MKVRFGSTASQLGTLWRQPEQETELQGNGSWFLFSRHSYFTAITVFGVTIVLIIWIRFLLSRTARGTSRAFRRSSFSNLHDETDSSALRRAFHEVYNPPTTPTVVKTRRFNAEKLGSSLAKGGQKDDSCAICLDSFGERHVSGGECGHVMHTNCLAQWLSKDEHGSCPICRQRYADDDEFSSVNEVQTVDGMSDLDVPVLQQENRQQWDIEPRSRNERVAGVG